MSITLESSNATSLDAVKHAFDHWRRSRTQRRITPIELREKAVALMAQHKRVHICKALRINDQALKQWAAESGRVDRGGVVEHQRREFQPTGRFVELPLHKARSTDVVSVKPVTALRIELPNGTMMSTDRAFTLEQILSVAVAAAEPDA